MRRLLSIAVSFLVIVSLATTLAWRTDGERALQLGEDLEALRAMSKRVHKHSPSSEFLVAWMGDSTMLSKPDNLGYNERVATILQPKVDALHRVSPGLTFFHHYLMLPGVLGADPDLIVVNANLRLMDPSVGAPLSGLESMIPTAELPRAVTLPFNAVGMTIPHLLLARLDRIPAMHQTLLFSSGLRQQFYDVSFGNDALGWEGGLRLADDKTFMNRPIRSFDREFSRTGPLVEMMSATVGMAARNGVPTLVVVSPIPWERLQKAGLYSLGRADRRIGILRETVERSGGRLIDLHDMLRENEFRDSMGHVTARGNQKIGGALLPIVREMLGHQ